MKLVMKKPLAPSPSAVRWSNVWKSHLETISKLGVEWESVMLFEWSVIGADHVTEDEMRVDRRTMSTHRPILVAAQPRRLLEQVEEVAR